MIDFATRAANHGYKLDPIVRSLLDTDFYKLLMQQFIWTHYPNEIVRFKVTNRTTSIKIADTIDIDELCAQLDHARTLRFTSSELVWLRGQTFYGQEGIFSKGYIDTLRTFQLPEYKLEREFASTHTKDDEGFPVRTGQYVLTFEGKWSDVTMWEIPALTIINELRFRTLMRGMKKGDLDIMFAQAKVKLYRKLKKLQELPNLKFSDFGTRRRFGFLWQEYCVKLAKEMLGDRMIGTSNVLLAFQNDKMEPIGTNAHELPMVFAALARQKNPDDEEALRNAQYAVLRQWSNQYHGNLLVFLPDTFGTTQFLKNAPFEVGYWKGARPDSKDPIDGGEELIDYWKNKLGDSDKKIAEDRLIVAADGLDVEIDGFEVNGSDIPTIYDHFDGRVPISFGMGTNLTCDFVGCHPGENPDLMRSISIVAKVDRVNMTHPAVKLSDNFAKRTGDKDEVEYYTKVFGTDGMANVPVKV
jgi:nicotinate phosphoribosyltransferase